MTATRGTPTIHRASLRRVFVTLGLIAMALSFGVGCGAVRHMHPATGTAYNAVMKAQRRSKSRRPQMSGEDAQTVMANLAKGAKTSDLKQNKANFLLPLQR